VAGYWPPILSRVTASDVADFGRPRRCKEGISRNLASISSSGSWFILAGTDMLDQWASIFFPGLGTCDFQSHRLTISVWWIWQQQHSTCTKMFSFDLLRPCSEISTVSTARTKMMDTYLTFFLYPFFPAKEYTKIRVHGVSTRKMGVVRRYEWAFRLGVICILQQ